LFVFAQIKFHFVYDPQFYFYPLVCPGPQRGLGADKHDTVLIHSGHTFDYNSAEFSIDATSSIYSYNSSDLSIGIDEIYQVVLENLQTVF
jgi:hypothetical protein